MPSYRSVNGPAVYVRLAPTEDYAVVELTKGYEATIDLDDIGEVSRYLWCAHVDYYRNYWGPIWRVRARSAIGGKYGKWTYLHVFILGTKSGLVIDHIDGNPLNCRRSNLAFVTQQQNSAKRRRYGSVRQGQ